MANNDFLKSSSFVLQFKNQAPLELMVQSCNIPGFTLGELNMQRPVVMDKRPGDSLTYNDLTVSVICDEELKAYKEIYNYLILSANPTTGHLNINDGVFTSTLFLLTNKNNIQHQIVFHDSFFKSVSDIQMESTDSEDTQLTFSIDLGYTYFDFETP